LQLSKLKYQRKCLRSAKDIKGSIFLQGDWRGISRQFVQTRSPTQVASHAQKYFIRQSVAGKRKRRSSLFDLVPEGPVVSPYTPDVEGINVEACSSFVEVQALLNSRAYVPKCQGLPQA